MNAANEAPYSLISGLVGGLGLAVVLDLGWRLLAWVLSLPVAWAL